MADTRRTAHAHGVAERAYELQPVRSRAQRVGSLMLWAACAASLGAGVTTWLLKPAHIAQCPVVSHDALSSQLSDTQLRLEQERAARATLQTTADGAQATITKLHAELLFLRTHQSGPR